VRRVWVCVAVDSDDSHVVAVFSTEEQARRCERALHWDVSELPLDGTDVSAFPQGQEAFLSYFDWTPGRPDHAIRYVLPDYSVPTGWNAHSSTTGSYSFWAKDFDDARRLAYQKLTELVKGPVVP
jgi:hypothetical protein